MPKVARIRRIAPPLYGVHVRDLDAADVTRFEGIAVVTPRRAILDGIERHLDGRLINQAIDTARRRGLIIGDEVTTLEAAR